MPVDVTKPVDDPESRKNIDREARDMVSSIMSRISGLHKPVGGSTSTREEEDDNHGVRVITLTGTNFGATMRGDMDEKLRPHFEGMSLGEPDALSTYVNSNFQAVNNSVMMGGSYTANDPGVHLDISDFVEQKGHDMPERNGKKGKKKEKEKDGARSDHHTERSD